MFIFKNVDFTKQFRELGFTGEMVKNFVDDFSRKSVLLKALGKDEGIIKAWQKLSAFPSTIRTSIPNLTQRRILDEYTDIIASASDARKGNFGEIGADLDLNTRGYNSLQPRISDIDSPGHNGIDGVYEKNGQYYIVEGKYSGSASLNPADPGTGLPRQMSDAWIQGDNRLADAVGSAALANQIIISGYERILAKVAPDGSVNYKLIGPDGYLNSGGGDWLP